MGTREETAMLPGGLDPVRAWVAGFTALVGGVIVGSLVFTEQVYAGFVWHYFWGPVYADANSALCAVWNGGARDLLYEPAACRAASGIVAEPGYTLVSEVGYMVVLIFMLSGVVLLLRRLGVGSDRSFFMALLPFIFFGGALRVVEDASDRVPAGMDPVLTYPLNAFFISPVIYFTVFAIALAALVASLAVARYGVVDRYETALFRIGLAVLVANLAYLVWLWLTRSYVAFHPMILVVVLVGATVAAIGTWAVATQYIPELEAGTGTIGLIVIWGHAVDGVANVVGLDWGAELGLAADLVPKHPVNRAVVDITASVLPQQIIAITGDTWPFLLLKLLVATGAVWLFNDELIEESPRSTMLLLVAVLAVGLGPGTRDLLRATFGV
ncbi:MAG: DUF63 family protein [Halobacteriaceae archaeon]